MKDFSVLPAVRLAAMIAVVIASQAQQVAAGDCGCRRPAPLLPFAHAAVLPAAIPMPVLMPGCPCAGGMQLVSPGHVWSGGGWFTDSVVLHGGGVFAAGGSGMAWLDDRRRGSLPLS